MKAATEESLAYTKIALHGVDYLIHENFSGDDLWWSTWQDDS